MENVKDWLDKKGYHNSGLRTDRSHRIDLYLSDVLDEYRTEQLRLGAVSGQSEQLIDFADWVFDQPKHLGGRERELVAEYLKEINCH